MRKETIYLEFTSEEAALLVNVFSSWIENVNVMQLKLPAVDIESEAVKFVNDSLPLLKDAIAMEIGVILECHISIKLVLFSLAMLTAHMSTEDTDKLNTQVMIKLIHASKDGGR